MKDTQTSRFCFAIQGSHKWPAVTSTETTELPWASGTVCQSSQPPSADYERLNRSLHIMWWNYHNKPETKKVPSDLGPQESPWPSSIVTPWLKKKEKKHQTDTPKEQKRFHCVNFIFNIQFYMMPIRNERIKYVIVYAKKCIFKITVLWTTVKLPNPAELKE